MSLLAPRSVWSLTALHLALPMGLQLPLSSPLLEQTPLWKPGTGGGMFCTDCICGILLWGRIKEWVWSLSPNPKYICESRSLYYSLGFLFRLWETFDGALNYFWLFNIDTYSVTNIGMSVFHLSYKRNQGQACFPHFVMENLKHGEGSFLLFWGVDEDFFGSKEKQYHEKDSEK